MKKYDETTKNIDRIAFELWCGIDAVKDLEAWAAAELRKEDGYYDANKLFRLDRDLAEIKALEIAQETLGFDLNTAICTEWAKEVCEQQYKIYLTGTMRPYNFCEFIKKIDALFIDSPSYPDWLGDLYIGCDWCDERWTFQRDYHLAEEVERIVLSRNEKDR